MAEDGQGQACIPAFRQLFFQGSLAGEPELDIDPLRVQVSGYLEDE